MTIMITGASGFSGSHLANIVKGRKILLSRKNSTDTENNLDFAKCDLLIVEDVKKIIKDIRPEQIFHLAGSFSNNYDEDFKSNVTATKNILDAVKYHTPKSRILLIGSAAEYGLISKENCPVSEILPLSPGSIYGLTKIYQKYLMDYYVNTFSLDIVMARPFNLYGKNISPRLFIGKVYQEIEALKSGKITEISLGNLNSERDYISIEEAVEHYIKIMNYGVKGEIYNVGSGKSTKICDILNVILKEENVDFSVIKANTRIVKANDLDQIYADISKLEGLDYE